MPRSGTCLTSRRPLAHGVSGLYVLEKRAADVGGASAIVRVSRLGDGCADVQ
jgi:hypothetical protein